MFEEASAHINHVNKVQVQLWLLRSPFSVFPSSSYRRYFSLCSLLERCSTLVHHLSHHLSICPIRLILQLFLNDNLSGNTVQRSIPHKCGHKSRYNAFNVEVAAFHRYFGDFLPSSMSVRRFYVVGISWRTIIMVRVNDWSVFDKSEEEYLLGKFSGYFLHPRFQWVNLSGF